MNERTDDKWMDNGRWMEDNERIIDKLMDNGRWMNSPLNP
jgi:hypothetical protein